MPLRNLDEIKKAHDTLTHILLTDELCKQLPDEKRRLICASCDVLCWVLKHEHNSVFAENLKLSLDWLKANGYELMRIQ